MVFNIKCVLIFSAILMEYFSFQYDLNNIGKGKGKRRSNPITVLDRP
jgi:hypothetical protein